jgi:serine acetyltransferase
MKLRKPLRLIPGAESNTGHQPPAESFGQLVRSDRRSNPGLNIDAIKARLLLLEYRVEQAVHRRRVARPTSFNRVVWSACRFSGSVFQWLLFSCQISGQVDAGPGLRLPHPQNIIIGMGTRLGRDCSVYHNVTFARSTLRVGVQMADVGDRVVFGAGVTVMGAVRIGDDAILAAGAVVTKDVPAATIVISAPVQLRPRTDGGDWLVYPNPHPLAARPH